LEIAHSYSVFEIPNDLTMLHQHGGHYLVNSMRGWFRTANWNYEKWQWYRVFQGPPQFVREDILHWPKLEPWAYQILGRTITAWLRTSVCAYECVL